MTTQELTFVLTLNRAHAGLIRRFDWALGSCHGLSFADFVVLYHLDRAPEKRLRRVDLADRVGLTVSGVTRLLAPLEKRGIVTRLSDAKDARVAYAVITAAGSALFADALATAEDHASEYVPATEGNGLTDLIGTLARLTALG